MRILIFVLALVMVIPAFGQRKKKDNEPVTPTFTEGLVYSLPRTALRVYVKATREVFEPGPYAAYAEQLLGLTNVKTRPEKKWYITEVRITAFSEPDPEQVYKAKGDVAFKISLSADGRIEGLNLPNVTEQPKPVKTDKVIPLHEAPDDFSFANFNDTPLYTEGDSTNNFQPIRIRDEQKASEAAQRILNARLTRYDMVAGLMDEFHPDGEAYKVSLEELKKIEKNYLSLFTGRTTQKEDIFSFIFVPDKPTEKGEVVFRISDETGIVPPDDLSGKPVMIEFSTDKVLTDKYEELAKSENPNAGESGIYYRIPATTTVSIVNNLNVIATARLPIAQFGVVAPLPENIVKGGYMVKYHKETGALKSVYKR